MTNAKPVFVDYYEVLQISPNADQETVHRVYRMQAQRFHPDNSESGNAEKFRLIMEAYQALGDAEVRASYDVKHAQARHYGTYVAPQQYNEGPDQMDEAERREELVMLLYRRRLSHPDQPSIGLREIQALLEQNRDRIEFSLWYLKESGYVTRADSGRHTITIKGVQFAETMKDRPPRKSRLNGDVA